MCVRADASTHGSSSPCKVSGLHECAAERKHVYIIHEDLFPCPIQPTEASKYAHRYTRTHIHARTYTHAHTRTHIHTRTHTHAHTRMQTHLVIFLYLDCGHGPGFSSQYVHARDHDEAKCYQRVVQAEEETKPYPQGGFEL
jgi:hypothetical protein